MTDHTTDPCGHPTIALPRDRRIALAAERFVRAEREVYDARIALLKIRMRDAAPDHAAIKRLHDAKSRRFKASYELAVAVEEA